MHDLLIFNRMTILLWFFVGHAMILSERSHDWVKTCTDVLHLLNKPEILTFYHQDDYESLIFLWKRKQKYNILIGCFGIFNQHLPSFSTDNATGYFSR